MNQLRVFKNWNNWYILLFSVFFPQTVRPFSVNIVNFNNEINCNINKYFIYETCFFLALVMLERKKHFINKIFVSIYKVNITIIFVDILFRRKKKNNTENDILQRTNVKEVVEYYFSG